jgi:hypothetical protein
MNKGIEALNKILLEVQDMSPEEYMELYNQSEARLERPNRIKRTPEEIKEFNLNMGALIEKTTALEIEHLKNKGITWCKNPKCNYEVSSTLNICTKCGAIQDKKEKLTKEESKKIDEEIDKVLEKAEILFKKGKRIKIDRVPHVF